MLLSAHRYGYIVWKYIEPTIKHCDDDDDDDDNLEVLSPFPIVM